MSFSPSRHGRSCAGHRRLETENSWMAGSSPAMTSRDRPPDHHQADCRRAHPPRAHRGDVQPGQGRDRGRHRRGRRAGLLRRQRARRRARARQGARAPQVPHELRPERAQPLHRGRSPGRHHGHRARRQPQDRQPRRPAARRRQGDRPRGRRLARPDLGAARTQVPRDARASCTPSRRTTRTSSRRPSRRCSCRPPTPSRPRGRAPAASRSRATSSASSRSRRSPRAKKGVEKCYAMQAGREVRVMVKPAEIDDDDAALLAREIAKEIEETARLPRPDQGHRDPREPRRRHRQVAVPRRHDAGLPCSTLLSAVVRLPDERARRRAHPRSARRRRPAARRRPSTTPTCSSTTPARCGEAPTTASPAIWARRPASSARPAPRRGGRRLPAAGRARGASSSASRSSTWRSGPQNLHACRELLQAAVRAGRGGQRGLLRGRTAPSRGELPAHRERPFQAWVQIMAGCTNFCSYCIVPYGARAGAQPRARRGGRRGARPRGRRRARSHPARPERQRLRQRPPAAPRDARPSPACWRASTRVAGLRRLRFMTSHPRDLSDELVAAIAELPTVCEHVHLPAQSGSDRVLAAMGRGYTQRVVPGEGRRPCAQRFPTSP